jgi:hypothetical protein
VIWLSISLFLKTQQLSTFQILLFPFLRPLPLFRVLPRVSCEKTATRKLRCATKIPPLLVQTRDLNSKLGGTAICNKKSSSTSKSISLGPKVPSSRSSAKLCQQALRFLAPEPPPSNSLYYDLQQSSTLGLALRYSHDDFWDRDEGCREGRPRFSGSR